MGSERERQTGGERPDAEDETDDARVGEELDPEALDAPRMLGRRVRLCGLVGKSPVRVGQVRLVPVGRALEPDPEPGVVPPDPQADVGEHRPLRPGLDVLVRLGGRRDAEEGGDSRRCRILADRRRLRPRRPGSPRRRPPAAGSASARAGRRARRRPRRAGARRKRRTMRPESPRLLPLRQRPARAAHARR